ncbi:heme-binding protein [Natranaeroarchaeum sulfidigenes]|uniref:Chlorite dismutase n=1 Tax=Natranaeroarchaeum sulfidigenes TaxID=2784880 RepID=A0A897MTT5_9EURY|nr:heme-binding protein [Natranaeroarchaeum sulfidigenes]QSG01635.1 Chlorite dismutase [Natranaeroarchaeum sulfidigenes]
MDRREPPQTDEGWYVLHDLRTIDWDAWTEAAPAERERALDAGVEYLEAAEAVEDADEGASAVFTVLGHEADLMLLHLRPTLADLDTLERQFETTAFARFTEHTGSYVSVTEASGYTGAEAYFDPEQEADPGIKNYIESRLYPSLPDADFVSFYPMDKRRGPDHNWYDLSFEDRAELMSGHGDIGRSYAGKVSQIISGSVGLDDFEWGVTLFADDPTDVKDLLYEMRFDPSSSRYAEFGPFYSGRRFSPTELDAVLAGDPVGVDDADETGISDEGAATPADAEAEHGDAVSADADDGNGRDVPSELDRLGVSLPDKGVALVVYSDGRTEEVDEEVEGLRGNFEHYDSHLGTEVVADGEDTAVVSGWETDRAAGIASGFLEELPGVTGYLQGSLDGGESEFHPVGEGEDMAGDQGDEDGDDGDAHSGSDEDAAGIREELDNRGIYAGQPHGEDVYALVLYSAADVEELREEVDSLSDGFDRYDTHVKTAVYETADADPAVVSIWETEDAANTASDYLSDLPDIVRQAGDDADTFGTMGMFYTVKPEHEDDFVEKFDTVGDLLAEMDGHRQTDLYANVEDDCDMFIASRWDTKEDCMEFFRSDAFSDTVDWGRDVLADRPRHVFLA